MLQMHCWYIVMVENPVLVRLRRLLQRCLAVTMQSFLKLEDQMNMCTTRL